MDDRLVCPYSPKLRTTALMDCFERRDAAGRPLYHTLLLTGCFFVRRQELFSVSLQIERWDWQAHFINDFMTFSRFKKNVAGKCFTADPLEGPALVRQLFALQWAQGMLCFPQSIALHAQCSAHRAGFGATSCAGVKRYGETTHYLITGALLQKESAAACPEPEAPDGGMESCLKRVK